ncbi:MAG: AAA family ATPase [Saprospiraceae bacterium]
MGKIVAIANQKGGVGKTTTAINLASTLGILDKRVLLIDSDPQANTTTGVGISEDEVEYGLYDCLVDKNMITKAILETEIPNLDLLPSSIDLVGAEIELVNKSKREYALKKALKKIKGDYDYIIIDCLPSLGLLTLNALTAADSVLIPVQCEVFSLAGLGKLKRTIQGVQNEFNSSLEIEGIILSMYDSRLRMANMVVEEVRNLISDKIFETIIHRNSKVGESPSVGKPVILYDASSKGAMNFLNLATEFLRHNNDEVSINA